MSPGGAIRLPVRTDPDQPGRKVRPLATTHVSCTHTPNELAVGEKRGSFLGRLENECTLQVILPGEKAAPESSAYANNIQLLKNTNKFLRKIAEPHHVNAKSGAGYAALREVCSCSSLSATHDRGGLKRGEMRTLEKTLVPESELKSIRGAKTFRRIFTPQGEPAELATKKRKTGDKLRRLVQDNCSASTATNSSGKHEAGGMAQKFQLLRYKMKAALDTYRKREVLLIKRNKKLATENAMLRKQLSQIQGVVGCFAGHDI